MFSNHVSTCAFTIVINSKRGGALKEYQSFCSIVHKSWAMLIHENMQELSLRHWVEISIIQLNIENGYGDYLRGMSVSTFVCAGSLAT